MLIYNNNICIQNIQVVIVSYKSPTVQQQVQVLDEIPISCIKTKKKDSI